MEYEKIATFLCSLFTHRLENNVVDLLIKIWIVEVRLVRLYFWLPQSTVFQQHRRKGEFIQSLSPQWRHERRLKWCQVIDRHWAFVFLIDLRGQTEAFLETNHNVSGHVPAIYVCDYDQALKDRFALFQVS